MKEKVNRFSTLSKVEVVADIKKYLNDQHELLVREMISKDSFDKSSWSEYQAYLLGSLKMVSKLNEYIPDLGE